MSIYLGPTELTAQPKLHSVGRDQVENTSAQITPTISDLADGWMLGVPRMFKRAGWASLQLQIGNVSGSPLAAGYKGENLIIAKLDDGYRPLDWTSCPIAAYGGTILLGSDGRIALAYLGIAWPSGSSSIIRTHFILQ